MRKIHKTSKFLALTLTASIAAFGCTTNWTRSNGEPGMGTTSATAPTATPGTSGGTVPQPMTSSSSLDNSQIQRRSPEQALAIMQQSSPTTQGRYLGVVSPPNTGDARIGGYMEASPGFNAAPQRLTINSSISNPLGPQAAVISGAGDDAMAIFGDAGVAGTTTVTNTGTTGAVFATGGTIGTSGNVGVSGTTPSPTLAGTVVPTGAATSVNAPTPTTAALPVTSGVFSGSTGTLTPSVSSAAVPTATVSTSPVVVGSNGMLSSSTVAVGTTPNAAVTNSNAAVTTSNATVTASPGTIRLNRTAISNGTTSNSRVTVSQSSSGKIVISNQK